MELIFLGTSAAVPTVFRGLPSVALRFDDGSACLFDCGEGTQRQMMRSGMSFMDVNRILLSHFHCDHHLGLSGLLQTMNMSDRKESVEIIGPEGTAELMGHIKSIGHFSLNFELVVRELCDGEFMDCGKYSIRCIQNNHAKSSLCYAIEEKQRPGRFDLRRAKELGIPEGPLYRKLQGGKSISLDSREIKPEMVMGPSRRGRKVAYSGDTGYLETFADMATGSDVLIHEATFSKNESDEAKSFKHSTASEAARIAERAGVKKLFLTHISARYGRGKDLEAEAKGIFPESEVAEDFMRYEIRYRE